MGLCISWTSAGLGVIVPNPPKPERLPFQIELYLEEIPDDLLARDPTDDLEPHWCKPCFEIQANGTGARVCIRRRPVAGTAMWVEAPPRHSPRQLSPMNRVALKQDRDMARGSQVTQPRRGPLPQRPIPPRATRTGWFSGASTTAGSRPRCSRGRPSAR